MNCPFCQKNLVLLNSYYNCNNCPFEFLFNPRTKYYCFETVNLFFRSSKVRIFNDMTCFVFKKRDIDPINMDNYIDISYFDGCKTEEDIQAKLELLIIFS